MCSQLYEGKIGLCAYLGAPRDLGMHMVKTRFTALVLTDSLGGVSKDIPPVQPIVNSSMDEAQSEGRDQAFLTLSRKFQTAPSILWNLASACS